MLVRSCAYDDDDDDDDDEKHTNQLLCEQKKQCIGKTNVLRGDWLLVTSRTWECAIWDMREGQSDTSHNRQYPPWFAEVFVSPHKGASSVPIAI